MSLPPVRLPTTGLAAVDAVLRDTVADLRQLLAGPFQKGSRLTGVVVGPGNTPINHGLGAQPQGYLVTRQKGAGPVEWAAWDDKRLTLSAPVATTVDLWVF